MVEHSLTKTTSVTVWILAWRWRRRRTTLFIAFGQQTQLIDAGRANLVDDGDNGAIFGPSIALQVHGLIQLAGNAVLHLSGQVRFLYLGVAKEDISVASNSHHDRIFLVGILHVPGSVGARHIHWLVLLQHGRDDHENDQKHEHDVRHRNDVRRGHLAAHLRLIATATGLNRSSGHSRPPYEMSAKRSVTIYQ